MSAIDKRIDEVFKRYDKKVDKIFNNYDEYHDRIMREYNEFCERIMSKWGDKDMVESTNKEWVEYSKDEDSRAVVDFENGTVTIEVLRTPSEDEEDIIGKLEETLEDILESKGNSPGFSSDVLPEEEISDRPILEGQIDFSQYDNKDERSDEIAKEIVEQEEKNIRRVRTEEGEKEIISINLALIPEHIRVRAEKFKDFIRTHSTRFVMEEPLIYAIIEQESYFNPVAKSHAPAYGLMQIVPKSGGLDANRYVHNRDIIPTPAYLYDPNNNIELGTGYLKKQMEVYFEGVLDPRNRMLCAIAAYNTGQGNVYYALTGKRSKDGAIKKINTMNYDQLYEYLKKHLPHSETRDYIQKVTSKIKKYSSPAQRP